MDWMTKNQSSILDWYKKLLEIFPTTFRVTLRTIQTPFNWRQTLFPVMLKWPIHKTVQSHLSSAREDVRNYFWNFHSPQGVNGSNLCLIYANISPYAWREYIRSRITSARILGVLVKIRTCDLQNTR